MFNLMLDEGSDVCCVILLAFFGLPKNGGA